MLTKPNLKVKPASVYTDNMGTEHPYHTDTGEEQICMESLMYTIQDGGDHTNCQSRELPVSALGSKRIS